MKVNELEIIIQYDDSDQDRRTENTATVLRELADQISEYGIPNADGVHIKFRSKVVGHVQVDWEDSDEE